MQKIKKDLSEELETVEIHIFADLHIGDCFCDLKEIKKRIDEVKEKDNAYIILNGDLINNATRASVSDIYSETMTPMQALTKCYELFEPVKDKILCITEGNHERRTHNGAGVDLMEILAKELGVMDCYSPTSAVLFLRFGCNKKRKRKQWYSLYVTHGSGGGRKPGGKINRLTEMQGTVDCDIYIHSHTHMPAIIRQGFYRTDFVNSSVSFVDKLFINTSAELDYGGYGEAYEFSPASKRCPVLYLRGDSKEYDARL